MVTLRGGALNFSYNVDQVAAQHVNHNQNAISTDSRTAAQAQEGSTPTNGTRRYFELDTNDKKYAN